MQILGYGEDALTLWAMKNRLPYILSQFNDNSLEDECIVFYRPSFGRRGGINRAEFGEFDAIVLSKHTIYLIESKENIDKSKTIVPRSVQTLRHKIFRHYVDEWYKDHFPDWTSFEMVASSYYGDVGFKKLAPVDSLLSDNLGSILRLIKERYIQKPDIKDVLLHFPLQEDKPTPLTIDPAFTLVTLTYTGAKLGNYISL
ncbi:hypothetical protein [Paenibacillus daejeonensis]|uniref:hypothetical protein n=1 Tax=Paenibacillus daejeonensis TaxID=135193 RepID=UPI000370898B|nr:hypothetical protein [Paenibacillus daejeonensis]